MGIATFFEDIKFGGRNKVKDFTFEEELIQYDPIHIVATDVTNSVPQMDIVISTLIQYEEIIHEEQTQHPQESMP